MLYYPCECNPLGAHNKNVTKLEFLELQHNQGIKLIEIKYKLKLFELKQFGTGDEMENPEVVAIVQEFNVATDEVAARIDRIVAGAIGLSVEDKMAFAAVTTRLHALGKDSVNPIP